MADPISMAMVGAALGGGMSAARGGNPLKGALLGAVGGGIGGAVAAGAGASAGAAAGATQAAGIAANPALSMGAANTAAGATMANPGLLATLKQVPSSLNTFAKENPFTMNLASNAAQEEFRQKQVANPGLLRGTQVQEQAMQYTSPIPKISLM
jgi:hypothetical protein